MSKTKRSNAAMNVALTLIGIFALFAGASRPFEHQAFFFLCILGVIALVLIPAWLRIF